VDIFRQNQCIPRVGGSSRWSCNETGVTLEDFTSKDCTGGPMVQNRVAGACTGPMGGKPGEEKWGNKQKLFVTFC
jgi:hypothetical protein